MSLRKLTAQQLAEDRYWGDDNDREAISMELQRRSDEREERMARAEDARDE